MEQTLTLYVAISFFSTFEKHVKDKWVAERIWLHIRKVVEEREGGATHAEKEIVVPTPLWLIFIGQGQGHKDLTLITFYFNFTS